MPADNRYYGWCFTLNNHEDSDHEALLKMHEEDLYKYIVFGRETGDNGTPHLQGYVFFKLKKTLVAVRKLLTRAHWEPQRGNFTQAIEYCKKDGDFFEEGEPPMDQVTKGKRGAEYWLEQKSLAKRGKLDEVDPQLFITHYGSLRAIQKDYSPMPDPLDDVCGSWFYGASGLGKSHTARAENPGFYLKMCNKWWDGYQNEEVVIIEDFDKSHAVLGHHLKIWADKFPFPAEIKGGKINIRPKKIIITSNYSLQDIWGSEPNTLEPLERRFKIKHFLTLSAS